MFCRHCGLENEDSVRFCIRCGAQIGAVDTPMQYMPTSQQAQQHIPPRLPDSGIDGFELPLLMLLHYSTLGLFSLMWLNAYHGKLPRRRDDELPASQAIGFLFIPIFNLYWFFYTHLQLCKRVNELRQKCGMPQDAPVLCVILSGVCLVVPVIGWIIGYLIVYPMFAWRIQQIIDEMVLPTHVTASAAMPPMQPQQGAVPRQDLSDLVWRCQCGEVNIKSHSECRACGYARTLE